MGVYYRYATALLILLSVSLTAEASTRKTVNHGQSRESVIKGGGSSYQTPNGDAAFYGQDYVDTHAARNLLNTGPVGSQKINVRPTVTIDPKKAAKSMIGGLRGGVPGVVASAAASAIIGAIDGVIDDGVVKIPSYTEVPPTSSAHYYWSWTGHSGRYSSADAACRAATGRQNIRNDLYGQLPAISFRCHWINGATSNFWGYVNRYGSSCPPGSAYSNIGACFATSLVPPSDSDWLTAEQWAAARNSDFVRDMVRASCEGSNAPGRCYEEMSEWGNLQGPASQTGPAQVTTSTKTNPDGTTSTTTTTTQNRYEYNFGPNHYNYTTNTKSIQDTDGVVTETETNDGIPTENPTQDEESVDYTFEDSEFPEVTGFYEQKYPDGLTGVWNDIRTQIDQSAFMQFLQGFIPNFSGSCPAFSISLSLSDFGYSANHALDSGIVCYSLDFAKVILLFTAVLTFRALVFGG